MMWWKIKHSSFFDNFEAHANEILAAAKLLHQLFTTNAESKRLSLEISRHEQAANSIGHEIVRVLNKEFILPMDREDSLLFIKTLDDVIDLIHHSAEAVADIFCIEKHTSFAIDFSDIILKSCEELPELCRLLQHPSKHSEVIGRKCIEIHRLEKQGDELRKEALHSLFSKLTQKEVSVADYLAWRDIYSLLESVTDKIEDCANVAEQITMKYS